MTSIFDSIITSSITPVNFAICTAASVVIGLAIAFVYMFTCKKHSASFVTTLALLPAAVQVVIMLVNGNLGAGVAVAGAFSLVRFRSIPGTAREIAMIFIGLAAGLATGMGYITVGLIFTLLMALLSILYSKIGLGEKAGRGKRALSITIPESLNYTDAFEDLFFKYTDFHELQKVKTTNMGSMFKLSYEIRLKDASKEKEFIDALRCRNGNLEISCGMLMENPLANL